MRSISVVRWWRWSHHYQPRPLNWQKSQKRSKLKKIRKKPNSRQRSVWIQLQGALLVLILDFQKIFNLLFIRFRKRVKNPKFWNSKFSTQQYRTLLIRGRQHALYWLANFCSSIHLTSLNPILLINYIVNTVTSETRHKKKEKNAIISTATIHLNKHTQTKSPTLYLLLINSTKITF